jgi:hypothetical protein
MEEEEEGEEGNEIMIWQYNLNYTNVKCSYEKEETWTAIAIHLSQQNASMYKWSSDDLFVQSRHIHNNFCHRHTTLVLQWATCQGSKKNEARNIKEDEYEAWNKFHSMHWLAKNV